MLAVSWKDRRKENEKEAAREGGRERGGRAGNRVRRKYVREERWRQAKSRKRRVGERGEGRGWWGSGEY